jgi:hypothetical protein
MCTIFYVFKGRRCALSPGIPYALKNALYKHFKYIKHGHLTQVFRCFEKCSGNNYYFTSQIRAKT